MNKKIFYLVFPLVALFVLISCKKIDYNIYYNDEKAELKTTQTENVIITWSFDNEVYLNDVLIESGHLISNNGIYVISYKHKKQEVNYILIIEQPENKMFINGLQAQKINEYDENVILTWDFDETVTLNDKSIKTGHEIVKQGIYELKFDNNGIIETIVIIINHEIKKVYINGEERIGIYKTNEEVEIVWTGTLEVYLDNKLIDNNYLITEDGEYHLTYLLNSEIVKLVIVINSKQEKLNFIDLNENIIENKITNNLPFTIENPENSLVYVNKELLTENQRFYEVGEYVIVVLDEFGNEYTDTIHIKEVQEKNHYNLIYTFATLPTLFTMIDTVEHNYPGFIWYGRSGTINDANLKAFNEGLVFSQYIGSTTNLINGAVRTEGHNYIKSILEEDPDAYFHLYVDDFRHWIEFALLWELGLNDSRYEVIYLSDGTYTYTKKYSFNQPTGNNYEAYLLQRDYRNKMKKEILTTNKDYSNDEYLLGGPLDFYDNFILLGPSNDNISYWMQFPDLLPVLDPKIQYDMRKSNIKEIKPEEMFESFSETNKSDFLNVMGLDKDYFDEEFFNKGDNNLVITGTSGVFSTYTIPQIKSVLDQVETEFSEYNIYFKPHPSFIPSDENFKEIYYIFLERNIQILPGRMPMEVITWVYPNTKLGGFNSSLYMSVPRNNTLFFFAPNKESLIPPLNELYDKLFSETIFINPK